MLRFAAVALAALVLGLLAAGPAWAFPGANGLIVFEDDGLLKTIDASGQGLAEIPGSAGMTTPTVSPDGTRIAVDGVRTLGISGANPMLLATGTRPAWSPDGLRLVYEDAGDLWVTNADGSGTPIQLTSGPEFDRAPSWSPTGRIAFVSNRSADRQVWTMASDGGDIRQVSVIGDVESQRPSWSPDGSKVVYAIDDGSIVDLYVSDTTAAPSPGNDTRITINGSSAVYNDEPAWSPDGTRIAFSSNRTGTREIWTVAAPGGGGEVRVTTSGGRKPDWQPLAVPTPVPTPAPAPAAPVAPVATSVVKPVPKVSDLVLFQTTRKCVSRRKFSIRLRVPRDAGVIEAVVRVNGKRVATRRGTRLRSTVDLRSLPKGRFRVEVRLKLTDGRSVKDNRRYRTCTPKRRAARRS